MNVSSNIHPKNRHLFSKDIEQMVLGCILSSQETFQSAFEKEAILHSDFYYPEHRNIFLALTSLYKKSKSADFLLLSEELKKNDWLEKVGGISYLAVLPSIAGTSAYFESYVQDLKELATKREFIRCCEDLQDLILSKDNNVSSIAAVAADNFSNISKKTIVREWLSLSDVAKGDKGISFLSQLDEKRKRFEITGTSQIPGIPTGFASLDAILGGLREENLILIAARPSIGKTAFALNLVKNLGLHNKLPVAFFSLEMTRNQIFLRLLAAQSGVAASKIEMGSITNSEIEQIDTAIEELEKSKIFISDSCYQVGKIIAQMRALVKDHEVAAFFVDYIGLVEPSRERDIKAYEIGDITRAFKNFANEFKVPIVCLAQLNRQAEQSHKPQLSMLKDSGNLESDADSVIFLHRRDFYDPNDKPGQIEVIVAKNRHGSTDSKWFQFKKEIGVITETINYSSVSWD